MLQYESQQDSQPDHGGDRSWPNTMSHQKNKTFLASQTCSNKHAIGFSNHKHTPITTTQKKSHVHWGHPFHYRHPTPEPTEPNSHSSWSDPVETLSCGPRSRRGNEI